MTYQGTDHLHVALDDAGVLRVGLDKPRKRNALDDDIGRVPDRRD